MTVASKTPIQHHQHKPATKKSSLKSTLTKAFSRHAATTGALDEYTRSMREYLDHSDDVDLHGRSSRETSPEFCWRDLNDIHLPNTALSSNAIAHRLAQQGGDSSYDSSRRESRSTNGHDPYPHGVDHDADDSNDEKESETSSLSSRISAMHIGGTTPTAVSAGPAAPAMASRIPASSALRSQQHLQHHFQRYDADPANRIGGAGPAWHFHHQRPRKKPSSSVSASASSSSLSKKYCVK